MNRIFCIWGLLGIAILGITPLYGMGYSQAFSQDTIPKEDVLGYQQQLAQLDSLYLAWYSRQLPVLSVMDSSDIELFDKGIPEFHDTVYAQRLKDIPSAVELTYNPRVKSLIDLYVIKWRNQV